jgi:hypothetical protein
MDNILVDKVKKTRAIFYNLKMIKEEINIVIQVDPQRRCSRHTTPESLDIPG